MRLHLLSLLAVLVVPGCASERSSPECKDVCQKQARCVDQTSEAAARAAAPGGAPKTPPAAPEQNQEQNKFDQSECIEACTSLRRDSEGAKLVAQHIACVERAKEDCTALLACP